MEMIKEGRRGKRGLNKWQMKHETKCDLSTENERGEKN